MYVQRFKENDPDSRHAAVVKVEAEHLGGRPRIVVTVGYELPGFDGAHFFPCYSTDVRTERQARRAIRKLTAMYEANADALSRAEAIADELNGTDYRARR